MIGKNYLITILSKIKTNINDQMLFFKKIKDRLPPIVITKLKSWFRRKKGSYFTGEYDSWEKALDNCEGYDDKSILRKVLSSAKKVKSGEVQYERDGVIFDDIEYSWELLAGLLWAAAQNGGRLNVIDIGGSLGTTYFQNKKFLKSISEILV